MENYMNLVKMICGEASADCRSLNKSDLARQLLDLANVPASAVINEIPVDWADQCVILFELPGDDNYYSLFAGLGLDGVEHFDLAITGTITRSADGSERFNFFEDDTALSLDHFSKGSQDEMPTAENSDLDVYVRNGDNGAAYTVRFPASWDAIVSTLQRIGVMDEDEEISAEYCEVVDFTDGFEMFGELRTYSLCEIAEAYDLVSSLDKWDTKTLCASCEWDSPRYVEDLMDRAEDVKRGDIRLYEDIDNDYDLGYYWIEESGCYDLSNLGNLAHYIDYEAFGRDISIDADGGFTSYGFVERC